MESDDLKYEKLKKKILEKLNSKEIESSGNIINIYDLIEILILHYNEYKELYENKEQLKDKINLNSRIYNLFKIKIPQIISINCKYYPIKNSNLMLNIPVLEIIFDKQHYALYSKNEGKYYCLKTNYNDDLSNFYSYNSKILNKYLDKLEKFNEEYPLFSNLNVDWFKKNKSILVDDGFVYCDINFNHLNHSLLTLSNKDDLFVSLIRKNNLDRELYEYIEFYNEALQKRTSVNLNKLDPSIRYIVSHYYTLDKPLTRILK